MSAVPPIRARGRPSDPAKRRALVDAARALFLLSGIEAVKVDDVIAAAGVSRATYYRNFAGRDALLAAVFTQESERIASDGTGNVDGATLRDRLVDYGDAMMRFLADPDTMRFEAAILHLRAAQPALADDLFAAGPGRAWARLERLIVDGSARGEIGDADPRQAVNDLVGLWVGGWRTAMGYGHRAPPDRTEQRRRSRHAVDLFLRAHPVGPSGREQLRD